MVVVMAVRGGSDNGGGGYIPNEDCARGSHCVKMAERCALSPCLASRAGTFRFRLLTILSIFI